MRTLFFALSVSLLFQSSFAGTATASKRVAVLPITNSAQVPGKQVTFLTQVVRQEGINALSGGPFQIMTQANLEALLPPGKTLADCIDECAIKTGRNLKAHYVVTGQLEKAMGGYRLTISVYATRSGTYLEALMLVGRDILGLEKQIKARARAAFATIRTDAQGSRFALGGSGAIVVETKPPEAITMTKRPRKREFLAFTSKPFGAKVMVNGRQLCETPCQRVVPHGTHTVSLAHPCFEPNQVSVEVGPERLVRRGGAVEPSSGPTYGAVGIPGQSPLALQFKAQSTQVTLDLEVDDKAARVAQVSDGERLTSIPLSQGRGQLTYPLGQCEAAASARSMSAGPRTLTVSLEGHVPVTKTFAVRRGPLESWRVRVRAVPQVTLECSTPTATLYRGTDKVGVGRVQLTLDPGEYRFSCGLPDAAVSSKQITLRAGDKSRIQLKAAAQGKVTLICRGQSPGLYFGPESETKPNWRIEHSEYSAGRKQVTIEATPGPYSAYCMGLGGTSEKRAVRIVEGGADTVSMESEDHSSLCRREQIMVGFGWLLAGGAIIAATVGTEMQGYAAIGGLVAVGGPSTWIKAYEDDGPCGGSSAGAREAVRQTRSDVIAQKWADRHLEFVGAAPQFVGTDVVQTRGPQRAQDTPEPGVSASDYNTRAWNLLRKGDGVGAERAIHRGLQLEPKNSYLLTNMAHVYLFTGRYAEAKRVLKTWSNRFFTSDDRFNTYRDGFLDDYRIFAREGAVPKQHRPMFRFFYERLKRGSFGD